VQLELNGAGLGPHSALAAPGFPLALTQMINVEAVPAALNVIVTGLGVTLAPGTSATLSIIHVSSP
jgi:hypothetical protein